MPPQCAGVQRGRGLHEVRQRQTRGVNFDGGRRTVEQWQARPHAHPSQRATCHPALQPCTDATDAAPRAGRLRCAIGNQRWPRPYPAVASASDTWCRCLQTSHPAATPGSARFWIGFEAAPCHSKLWIGTLCLQLWEQTAFACSGHSFFLDDFLVLAFCRAPRVLRLVGVALSADVRGSCQRRSPVQE